MAKEKAKKKNFTKRLKLVRKTATTVDVSQQNENEDEDAYQLSIQEDVVRLQDENRYLKSEVKQAQRDSTLFKSLAPIIEAQSPFSTFLPYSSIISRKAKITESAMLMLSDSHSDQEIMSKRVRGLEEYGFEIACQRAERIVDTTISHLIDNMKNYKFETLYIAGLGDYVNGEIHRATEHSKWGNSLKNSMGMGELLAMMITDLSRHFPKIVLCSVSGNHGRKSIKKDYRGAHDNWDYLVVAHAAARLKGLVEQGRLEIVAPDAWSMMLSVYKWNFMLNHGDDIRSWNSLPWYGIERKTRRLNAIGTVQGQVPHYYLFGHFHTMATQQHTTGETIINGSWAATDEYALESLGAFSEPYQWLFGIHPSYGLSWRMPIKLRKNDWQSEIGKQGRYSITMLEGNAMYRG